MTSKIIMKKITVEKKEIIIALKSVKMKVKGIITNAAAFKFNFKKMS